MRFVLRLTGWIFGVIGVLTVVAVVAVVVIARNYAADDDPAVPPQAVLWLDFNSGVVERAEGGFFPRGSEMVMADIVRALDAAAEDPRILGVAGTVGGAAFNIAQAQEIADALMRFRETGKPAIAFAEDLGSAWNASVDYMVAGAFGDLWLQPSGGVGLNGLALEMPFFSEALDEIGVSPQFEQRHEFKGGIDAFVEDGLTPALRRSLSRLLESWTGQIGRVLARAGRLPAARDIGALLNDGPYLAADAADIGLVDKLGYWDEAQAAMDAAFRDVPDDAYVAPGAYLAALDAAVEDVPGTKIALIYGVGPILPDARDDPFAEPGFSPYAVAEALSMARDDSTIAAVVLRIDSPGGAYGPSDAVWREVVRLRGSGKPVIVSMGGAAASGGYFVSMAADTVIAQPGTLTGSIGVYSGKFATAGLWDKIGVNWDRLQVGRNAGLWSPITPFSESERRKFRESVDFVYRDFTRKVADARALTEAEIDIVARGRVWSGEDAVAGGLVDRIGGLLDAIEEAGNKAGLAPGEFTLIELPERLTPFERFLEALEGGDPFGGFVQLVRNGFAREVALSVLGPDTVDRLSLLNGAATAGQLHMPPVRLAR